MDGTHRGRFMLGLRERRRLRSRSSARLLVLASIAVVATMSLAGSRFGVANAASRTFYAGSGKDYGNNGPSWEYEQSKERFSFRLSPNGHQVLNFYGKYFYYCGTGTGYVAAKVIPVSAAGSFSIRFSAKQTNGQAYVSIFGRFAGDRSRASVSYFVDLVYAQVSPATTATPPPADPYATTPIPSMDQACAILVRGTAIRRK